jgi:uncharacterized iron-regulated membrane protein
MSFFHTFIHHPHRLWVRRALFQIHLWVGVLLSLYLVTIALTGSLLVFRSEFKRARLPKELGAYDAGRVAPIASVLARFGEMYPGGTLDNVQMPSAQMPAFVLSGKDGGQRPISLVADPVSAQPRLQPRTWVDWVYDLHVYLLLGRTYGMQVNGVGAAGLLLLTATGLFLWWPGVKLWARGLRIGLGRSWRRINFDAHNAIGFWTLLIVFWWALSGVYFAWYQEVTAAVAFVSPLRGMRSPGPAEAGTTAGRATLRQVLGAVHAASPEGRLFSLSDPALCSSRVYALLDLRSAGDFSHRDIVTVSTADARVLSVWHYGRNESAGDWVLWAMHPMHFGTLWGMAFKVIWAGCGVTLAVLTVTGLLMYWNRFLRHKVHSITLGRSEHITRNASKIREGPL